MKGGFPVARSYPEHPHPSCHALLYHNGSVLLIQRGREPFTGFWGLPGGGVELGETVEEALVREIREETGLEARVERFLYYQDAIARDQNGRVQFHYVIFFFLAAVTGGSLRAGDDAANAAWFPVTELAGLQLTDSVSKALVHAGLSS